MDRQPLIADTDALIDFVEEEGAHGHVAALLASGRLATTAVTVFEVWRGCRTDAERAEVRRALRGIRVYPVNDPAAKRAGEVCGELERAGRAIGERDALIAGVALAVGLPVVTSNVAHFRRVPGLRVVPARR